MNDQRPQVETVYRSESREECRKHALLLEAVGIRYEAHQHGGEFSLVVADADATWAWKELSAYARENRDWPRPIAPLTPRAGGRRGVLVYAAVLVIVAVLEQQGVFGFDWRAAGMTHAGMIRDGQWWRTMTALTLHSDIPHLFSNLVIGGLVALFAGQLLGSGLAWFSILIAGSAGNLLNAWIRPPGHTSVGASTAVFAALGLVAAYVWRRRRHLHASRLLRWAPLVGAVLLLAFLGTGGARTDVAAHVAGFLCGVILGAIYGTLGERVHLGPRAQLLLGLTALATLVLAWAVALTSHTANPH